MSIRCAIVGIGNCCSALVQGVAVAAAGERELEGVSFPSIGGFLPEALRFVAAFDIDARKVGTPLSAAIFSAPNCCFQIARSPGELGALPSVLVSSAPVMDGVAPHMLTAPAHLSFRLTETPALTRREVVELLAARQVDVLINYLPVGSRECTEFWAAVCIEAGVALANCIPCFVASDPAWEARFIDAGLPLIGDDMRSQFGASVVSQMLEELALARGVRITVHIQQNSGGNTDFLNRAYSPLANPAPRARNLTPRPPPPPLAQQCPTAGA
jgi:myo-inositol-1-phosphate synthase